MCVIIAAAIGNVPVLATDTRHTRVLDEGALSHEDSGGKILPVPGGWVAVTGNAHLGAVGLGVLKLMGLDDVEATSASLQNVAGQVASALIQQGVREDDLDKTKWVAVKWGTPPTVLAFDWTGALEASGPDTYILTLPPGGFEDKAVCDELMTEFRQALQPHPGPIVRAIAYTFNRAAGISPYVSRDIEVGAIATGTDDRPVHIFRRINPTWALASNAQVINGFGRTSPTTWVLPETPFSALVASAEQLLRVEAPMPRI